MDGVIWYDYEETMTVGWVGMQDREPPPPMADKLAGLRRQRDSWTGTPTRAVLQGARIEIFSLRPRAG